MIFIYDRDNPWKDGTGYNPKKGKTYSGKMTLVSPTRLNLRGLIGISLIGRTAIWTRKRRPQCQSPKFGV
jgi:uncharacterized protein (DUF2147 family)